MAHGLWIWKGISAAWLAASRNWAPGSLSQAEAGLAASIGKSCAWAAVLVMVNEPVTGSQSQAANCCWGKTAVKPCAACSRENSTSRGMIRRPFMSLFKNRDTVFIDYGYGEYAKKEGRKMKERNKRKKRKKDLVVGLLFRLFAVALQPVEADDQSDDDQQHDQHDQGNLEAGLDAAPA